MNKKPSTIIQIKYQDNISFYASIEAAYNEFVALHSIERCIAPLITFEEVYSLMYRDQRIEIFMPGPKTSASEAIVNNNKFNTMVFTRVTLWHEAPHESPKQNLKVVVPDITKESISDMVKPSNSLHLERFETALAVSETYIFKLCNPLPDATEPNGYLAYTRNQLDEMQATHLRVISLILNDQS